MEHKFDVKIAEVIGLEASIILNNLIFWVEHNKANNTNFYDGKHWTYNSVEAFKTLFPYLTKHKIINALKLLEENDLIFVGNYNKSNYDRTKWYSVNQSNDLLKNGNGTVENSKPIPDNKPNNKTKDNKQHIFVPPTQIEVENYFTENGYTKESGTKAFEYYHRLNWKDSNNRPVKNWKNKMLSVWFTEKNKLVLPTKMSFEEIKAEQRKNMAF